MSAEEKEIKKMKTRRKDEKLTSLKALALIPPFLCIKLFCIL